MLVSLLLASSLSALDCEPVRFVDVTGAIGIHFTHRSGTREKHYICEAKGCGAGLLDYDGDGDLDIYFVNGQTFEDDPSLRNALYRNDGAKFTDVTDAAGGGDDGWGYACAAADHDNDGDPDLLVTNIGPDRFYRNNGDGTFTEVSTEIGLEGAAWSTSAAFVDIDLDGWLDLYVARYIRFRREDVAYPCNWMGASVYCGPLGLPPEPDGLYRSLGDGGFLDVSTAWGIRRVDAAYGLGVVCGDLDGDLIPEIYVANDSVGNFLFHRRGDSPGFEEVGLLSGVATAESGMGQAGMGVSIGDYDGDNRPDIFVANFSHDYSSIYRNLGDLFFSDASFESGLATPSLTKVAFGAGFLDHDNDGDLDLFVANGHVYPEADRPPIEVGYAQANQLFRNDGGRFTDVSREVGLWDGPAKPSRGAAFGDLDNDGDIDIVVAEMDTTPTVLRNEGGNRNHWVMVRLRGRGGGGTNRDGIGARVTLKIGDRTWSREARGAYSFLSHNDLRVHFGLGGATSIDEIRVDWPSGRRSVLARPPIDGILLVREPKG